MEPKKGKILFVDDDQHILELYDEEFKEEGYEVILASDGDEGLMKFRQESPDLVVLDLNMPKRGGVSVLNTILGMNRQAKVIINSAYPQLKVNFMTWGANAFIVKSSNVCELKKKVRDTLGEGGENLSC